MNKCKIRIRNNLYYPLMLILFISLLNINEALINQVCGYIRGNFIIPLIILISQFFSGFLGLYKNNYSENELIKNKPKNIQADGKIKIYILIFFASYFNFIGILTRKHTTDFQLENRTRGFQIIFCAILCYFTIRIEIYRHQFLSLIIIFFIIILI